MLIVQVYRKTKEVSNEIELQIEDWIALAMPPVFHQLHRNMRRGQLDGKWGGVLCFRVVQGFCDCEPGRVMVELEV